MRHSELAEKSSLVQVNTIRVCDTDQGIFKEKITVYDEEYYVLAFRIEEGLPSFVEKGGNSWKLTQNRDGSTNVEVKIEMLTSGVMGFLLTPIMKRQLSKAFRLIIEELTYYIEKGKPHPRKLKALSVAKENA